MIKKSKQFIDMFFLLFPRSNVYGQGSTTSSISGKIVYEKNEPLAGAIIVAIHDLPSGTVYEATTNIIREDVPTVYGEPISMESKGVSQECLFYRLKQGK